jgi:excisionase family DNA binding protein
LLSYKVVETTFKGFNGVTMDTDKSLPPFLKTEEVLGSLKVTPRTLYRLIRAGELPAVRVGRQWRFRRADLENWLSAREAGGSVTQ